ncbi:MAG TPA: D-alanyl-D-alanine carboxypeptidase/D-alanyl-D-alanine-endopeptidase, partial [Planctomycetota bacterium]|nr:D-alanyl-D-alanine carboxypeptidase/D-alanyl-D-alanine-endopeptidase [Planctomycetota bacterium]
MKTALLLALALLAPAPPPQDTSLADALDAAVKAYRPRDGILGVSVHSVRAGAPVYASRADEPLLLASNTKLLTTAAALLRLGPDYRFRTLLAVADQDVHVFGAGDPNISGRFHDGDPTAVFKRWAAKLKAAGIPTFRHLVLHTGVFEGPSLNPGWKDYEAWRWYVAPFAPLSLNDNCVDVTIEPGREGDPVKVTLSPDTNYARVVVQAKTARRPSRPLIIQRAADAAVITLKGETGARDTYPVAVPDPTLFFGTVLLETLAREGVRCTGALQESAASAEEVPGLREIDVFESPLPRTLAACNGPSQNFYAEMILRVLGWRAKGKGTLENGLAAVREALEGLGLASLRQ